VTVPPVQGSKVDPLKNISVKGFAKAPRKGGSHADEELTEMEVGGVRQEPSGLSYHL
jgi:hypothetical protein